jgi:hypothetical protein
LWIPVSIHVEDDWWVAWSSDLTTTDNTLSSRVITTGRAVRRWWRIRWRRRIVSLDVLNDGQCDVCDWRTQVNGYCRECSSLFRFDFGKLRFCSWCCRSWLSTRARIISRVIDGDVVVYYERAFINTYDLDGGGVNTERASDSIDELGSTTIIEELIDWPFHSDHCLDGISWCNL